MIRDIPGCTLELKRFSTTENRINVKATSLQLCDDGRARQVANYFYGPAEWDDFNIDSESVYSLKTLAQKIFFSGTQVFTEDRKTYDYEISLLDYGPEGINTVRMQNPRTYAQRGNKEALLFLYFWEEVISKLPYAWSELVFDWKLDRLQIPVDFRYLIPLASLFANEDYSPDEERILRAEHYSQRELEELLNNVEEHQDIIEKWIYAIDSEFTIEKAAFSRLLLNVEVLRSALRNDEAQEEYDLS